LKALPPLNLFRLILSLFSFYKLDILAVPSLLPRSWQWQNYAEIFTVQPFARQYVNTLFVSVLGTAGNILFATLAGYGFARIKFPGRNTAFLFLLTALMMPIEVTIIPLFFQMKTFTDRDNNTINFLFEMSGS